MSVPHGLSELVEHHGDACQEKRQGVLFYNEVIGCMPTYEYLCKTCSHRFETWQKMTDEPLTVCPECGAHIRRVLYPTGVVFKGSGFYKTDHGQGVLAGAKGNENSKTESNGAAADSGGSTGEGKSGESKSSESAASGGSTTGSESKPPATGTSKVA